MKTFLTLFVLFFSSSVVADNLPTSLFGITLNSSIDLFLKDQEINNPEIIKRVDDDYYYYYEDAINFKKNSEFTNYYLTTDNKGMINEIGAFKATNDCAKEQDIYINIFSEIYDIDKENFSRYFYRGIYKDDATNNSLFDDGLFYTDINLTHVNGLILSFECIITDDTYDFYILLSLPDSWASWNNEHQNKLVKSINIDLLKINTKGFGVNKIPTSLFGLSISDSIKEYLNTDQFYIRNQFDKYSVFSIDSKNYQKVQMIYNNKFEYHFTTNRENIVLGIFAHMIQTYEINFENFKEDGCKKMKEFLIDIFADLYFLEKDRFINLLIRKRQPNGGLIFYSDTSFYNDLKNHNYFLLECNYIEEHAILSVGLLKDNYFDGYMNGLKAVIVDKIDINLLTKDTTGL